ncbi:hypothetical protein [Burkholderia multivorans]|uniref:hypothetical protein n=1 Tax=Burkholderia multivorans TaxID=87883 RepID=UPI000A456012|nr:hypothetical protein [Burkholderia multivorans]
MNMTRMTPFRQITRMYQAVLDIQHSLSQFAVSAQSKNERHQADIDSLAERIARLESTCRQLLERVEQEPRAAEPPSFVPVPPFTRTSEPGEFMPFSTCSVADFYHPRLLEICAMLNHHFVFHRKLWEWVFVVHHLLESGKVKPGARGLVFGVGSERLPALFAKLGAQIVATDAPEDIGESKGWKATGQHSATLSQIRYEDIVDGSVFDERVSYETCDMNHIPDHLRDFDFNWSSCCFEHLGNLEAGKQFVINAVEKCLRVGGVAVHTTEFNLTSDDDTLESGQTVLYRRRDLLDLVGRLRSRGHDVRPFVVAPDSHPLDFHVDAPPYKSIPHLKLAYEKYVVTSAGLVVTRGR